MALKNARTRDQLSRTAFCSDAVTVGRRPKYLATARAKGITPANQATIRQAMPNRDWGHGGPLFAHLGVGYQLCDGCFVGIQVRGRWRRTATLGSGSFTDTAQ